MIHIAIPGWRSLELAQLMLDINGTLSLDGELLPGVAERLSALKESLSVHLVTADTFGRGQAIAKRLGVNWVRIAPGQEAEQKLALLEQFGPHATAAIGNGANDVQMLQAAALGIAVLGPEGLAVDALQGADVVVRGIDEGLDLLLRPQRLIATMRR